MVYHDSVEQTPDNIGRRPAFGLFSHDEQRDLLGMTFRDYLAGQALAGIMANPALVDNFTQPQLAAAAKSAYATADFALNLRGPDADSQPATPVDGQEALKFGPPNVSPATIAFNEPTTVDFMKEGHVMTRRHFNAVEPLEADALVRSADGRMTVWVAGLYAEFIPPFPFTVTEGQVLEAVK